MLRAQSLRKVYSTGSEDLVVLDGLSLRLAPGESLAITGPSGCGKSTLLHILGALDEPTSGEVELEGQNPFGLGTRGLAAFRNRKIGFVFQDHHLLPQCTVLENVLVPTLVSGGVTPAAEEWARGLLERVGLSGRLSHLPWQLSGGERQRASVARALIHKPPLLLCDEPTGNLDAASARAVKDLLQALHGEIRNILIVVTHSLELASSFSRQARLREGRLEEGPERSA